MTKPAAKVIRTCTVCGAEFGGTTYGEFCPAHRAEKRKSALERHYYLTTTYRPTEQIDNAIRKVFTEKIGTLSQVAKQFRWSLNAVSRRANALGYSRPKRGAVWRSEEISVLQNGPHLAVITLVKNLRRRGFMRSECAVKTKMVQLGFRGDSEAMTAAAVAIGFGVYYRTVVRWINLGLLKAKRKKMGLAKYGESGRDPWMIAPDDLRKFVFENPLKFDIRQVDQLWFIDLVSAGRIGEIKQGRPEGYSPTEHENDIAAQALNVKMIAKFRTGNATVQFAALTLMILIFCLEEYRGQAL